MIVFEYDDNKNRINQQKHGVSFAEAKKVFSDAGLVTIEDMAHSQDEQRYYAFGKVEGNVMTVRFTMRGAVVRIFGAAYWRKGAKIYEKEHSL